MSTSRNVYTEELMFDNLVGIAKHLGKEPPRYGRPNQRHKWADETYAAAQAIGVALPALETYRARFGAIPDLMKRVMAEVKKQEDAFKQGPTMEMQTLSLDSADRLLVMALIERLNRYL